MCAEDNIKDKIHPKNWGIYSPHSLLICKKIHWYPALIDISSGFITWYRMQQGVLVCRKARGSLRSCGWSVFSVATHRAYQSWESLLIQLWRPRLTLLQVRGVDITFETSPHRSRLGIMMMVLAKERKKKYTPSLPWLIIIVKSFEKQVSTSFKMLMFVSRHHFQMRMRVREHNFSTKRHSGCWLVWRSEEHTSELQSR